METPQHVLKHRPRCPNCKYPMRWSGNLMDVYEYLGHCYVCTNDECLHTLTLKPEEIPKP